MCYSVEAPKYFKKGINVVPIAKNTKACLVPEWNKKDFSSDLDRYDICGIGLDLSSVDLIMLDIDTLDKELQVKIEKFLEDYPTPLIRKGSPNKLPARFYLKTWQEGKIPGGSVELMSANKGQMIQVVLPPTNYPGTDNHKYEWVGKYNLLNTDLSTVPPFPKDAWEKLNDLVENNTFKREGKTNTDVEIIQAEMDRCGRNSHTKLSSIMTGKIMNGDSIDSIVNDLLSYDEVKNKSVSFFVCKTEKWKQFKDKKANCYQFVLNCYNRLIKNGDISGIPESKTVDISNILSPKVEIDFNIPDIKKEYKKIPKLEGLGQVIFKDLYDNSPSPITQACYMNTLNLLSVGIGNNLFHKGTSSNLYQCLAAPSSSGKGSSFVRSQQILIEANLKHLIGSSNPTSDSVVGKLLEKSRVQTMFINEAEKIYKRISSDRTNFGLREFLTDVFDLGGKTLMPKYLMNNSGKTKEAESIGEIFSPHVNMVMTLTIDAFEKNVQMSFFETGLNSRFLYYFDDRFKRQKNVDSYNPPIDKKVVEYYKFFSNPSNLIVDATPSAQKIKILEAKVSDKAQTVYNDMFEAMEDEKEKMYGDRFFPLFSRKRYFMNKLTLIHHAMVNPSNYIIKPIEPCSYIWAKESIDVITHNMIINLMENVSGSKHGSDINKLMKFIKKRTIDKKGTSMQQISQRFRDSDTRSRQEWVDSLTMAGDIIKKGNDYYYVKK